jgi:pyridoxal phosphate enzyme (YggS family)
MTDYTSALDAVYKRIAEAEQRFGRKRGSVNLLAVSKTCSADAIRSIAAAGQRQFGESYLNEALPKIEALADIDIEWHFIGPIQSNKTRGIAEHFDWVHGIDRLRIAQRLGEQRPAGFPPLQVCIQLNISGEATKAGISPAEAPTLANAVAQIPGLKLRGLMAIPAPSDDPTLARIAFRQLREISAELQDHGLALDTLSMGMSSDLEAAIAEGATLVRVGSAIFGERSAKSG